jgi:hypothetical protein
MAFDRGLTRDPRVNIFPISEVYTGPEEALAHNSAVSQLIKDINGGFGASPAILRAVFVNRRETISWNKARTFS